MRHEVRERERERERERGRGRERGEGRGWGDAAALMFTARKVSVPSLLPLSC